MPTYEREIVSDETRGIWEEIFVAFEDNHIRALFLEIQRKITKQGL
jgi:hypothetical protein